MRLITLSLLLTLSGCGPLLTTLTTPSQEDTLDRIEHQQRQILFNQRVAEMNRFLED